MQQGPAWLNAASGQPTPAYYSPVENLPRQWQTVQPSRDSQIWEDTPGRVVSAEFDWGMSCVPWPRVPYCSI
jgi:hypothetical protein